MSALLIYVAGPYTHPDPVDNTRIAMEAADRIMDSGHCIPFIPHLTLFWHMHKPRPVGDWYAYDLEILGRCDAVLRLPGGSVGADNGVAHAVACSIPAYDDLDQMLHNLNPAVLAASIEEMF